MAAKSFVYPSKMENVDAHSLITFVNYKRTNPSSNPTTEITGSIILPLPQVVNDVSNIEINTENLGAFGKLLEYDSFDQVQESFAKEVMNIKDSASNFDFSKGAVKGTAAAIARAYMTAPVLRDTDAARFISRFQGQVRNPHTTAVFNGVQLKQHSFSWSVSPRSQDEADTLNNLIDFFKQRIHPEISRGGFLGVGLLDYPDEIYVRFPGTKLPSANKSFVTNFTAQHGGGADIALYKDGSSVFSTLSFACIEVDIRTRNDLEGSIDSINNPEEVIQ